MEKTSDIQDFELINLNNIEYLRIDGQNRIILNNGENEKKISLYLDKPIITFKSLLELTENQKQEISKKLGHFLNWRIQNKEPFISLYEIMTKFYEIAKTVLNL